jgi:meso-butanediol dehydrogenase / (S,S)-butanediol dehydrogenase / diacetyl reductase
MSGLHDGKVVLISGTAGGQGRAAALAFAREGALVVGCDIKAEAAQETVDLVRAAGGRMTSVHPVDLTDPAAVQTWIDAALAENGRIDVLYNNAASLRGRSSFAETTLEEWEDCLRLELTIVFLATKAVWPHMMAARRGVILNTASMSGHIEPMPIPAPVHGVAKAGILAFTRMLAAEGAPYGIRSVSMSPGLIRTPVTENMFSGPLDRRHIGTEIVRKTPSGRAGASEDVAELAVFLASDRAAYINATDVRVDGGLTGVSFYDPSISFA